MTDLPIIPFNRVSVVGDEYPYIAQAIANRHISGDGAFSKQCHRLLERELGAERALLTTSCTHALEMTALLLDISPGDEVIFPPFTFVTTVNAFVLRGAKPVFVDVRADTLNLDETLLEDAITPRTRAIVVVHYAGVGCEMDAIMEISRRHAIPVVEDNAHGLFGAYRGRLLGSFGAMSTLSFHETKNFSCGEGGALIINDPRYVERAEIIREKGTDRSKFFRGQVDKYGWVDVGSSYLPSDMLAAFLLAQLEAREKIQTRRQMIWEIYASELGEWAKGCNIRLPFIPSHCDQTYHMFYLLMPTLEQRQKFIRHLTSHGITAVFHYQPLHLSAMGQKFGGRVGEHPVTERVSDQLVRLPMHFGLTADEQARVVDTIHRFDGGEM
jgi:dTDP-4-amino-4,6-dideoxygalactose transaminase